MGDEAEFFAGFDVLGEVVDVEGFGGGEVEFADGVLVDVGARFDGADLVREDGALEKGEVGELLEDPGAVEGVGVGEEDEGVVFGGEFFDGVPHGLVGGEDVPPGEDELFVGGVAFEGFEGPGDVVVGVDVAGLELIFFGEELI